FSVRVDQTAGNHAPVIVSEPVTEAVASHDDADSPSLLGFSVVQFFDSPDPNPNWVLNPTTQAVTQTLNADGSAFLSDFAASTERLEWRERVNSSSDDDEIGCVVGYQGAPHLYLFEWKRLDQEQDLARVGLVPGGAP